MHFTCGANTFFPLCEHISHEVQMRSFLRANTFHTRSERVVSFMRTHFTRGTNAFFPSCKCISPEEQTCSFFCANAFHTWSKHVLVIVHMRLRRTANVFPFSCKCTRMWNALYLASEGYCTCRYLLSMECCWWKYEEFIDASLYSKQLLSHKLFKPLLACQK